MRRIPSSSMTTGSLERLMGSDDVLGQKRPARFLRVVTVKLLSLLGMTRPQRGAFSRICSLQTERWLGFLENDLLISGGGPSCHAFGNRVEHCFGLFISGSSLPTQVLPFSMQNFNTLPWFTACVRKHSQKEKKAAAAKNILKTQHFWGKISYVTYKLVTNTST